jgi:hypothetical protein
MPDSLKPFRLFDGIYFIVIAILSPHFYDLAKFPAAQFTNFHKITLKATRMLTEWLR